tara:strand:+ start:193 stop:432 length:240 start_codon:yes stop_codon:yes gene_type:complete
MNTIILSDGTLQHTLDGWIGIQNPNEHVTKTKWRKTNYQYWEINGYTITRTDSGKMSCECKGYFFRKKCRHIEEVSVEV